LVLEISYGSRAVEFERTKSDGTVLSFVSRPLDTGGMVVTLTDVTEAKQHERKLDEIAAQAEQAESRMSAALAAGKKQRDDANTLSEFGDWLHSNAFGEALVNLPCEHVSTSDSPSDSTHYLCVPIIAHGDTVGMLHIDLSAYAKDKPTEKLFSTDLLRIITRYAEHISLAVANVKLRQQLREQSTRDSLTGMYNRRHFTELAKDALAEAEESHQTAAIAVLPRPPFCTATAPYHPAQSPSVYPCTPKMATRCMTSYAQQTARCTKPNHWAKIVSAVLAMIRPGRRFRRETHQEPTTPEM